MGKATIMSQELTLPILDKEVAIPQLLNFAWATSKSAIAYEWDIINGKIEWFGKIAEQFGFKSNEFIKTQEAWVENIYPADRGKIYSEISRHLKSNDTFLCFYRVWHKYGKLVYVEDLATTLRNESGTPYKWLGLMRLAKKPWNYADVIEQTELKDDVFLNKIHAKQRRLKKITANYCPERKVYNKKSVDISKTN
jgi:hypothetical protein